MRRRRLLVVLPDLTTGGAERVVLTLLRHLSRARFELHLALVRREGELLEQLPPDVVLHDLGAGRVRRAGKPLVGLVRRLNPDTVVSTLFYLNCFLLFLRPWLPGQTQIVVREGNTLSEYLRDRRYGGLWSALVRWLYPRADCIVCQSRFMQDDLVDRFSIPRHKTVVIYNPVDVESVAQAATAGGDPFVEHRPGPHLVAAGRLVRQKGLDRLVREFDELARVEPRATLWILGRDPDPGQGHVGELHDLIGELGLEGRVRLMGFQANPHRWFRHADLFVQRSRYEGLPNALLEAMACGCPVVAVDSPGGTREVMELTGLRDRLLDSLDWRKSWFRGARAPTSSEADLSHFSLDRIVSRYDDLFSAN